MTVLVVALHVVSGVFIIGPMATLPMVGMRALRARQAPQVRSLAKSVNLLTLLSLIVVVLGFAALGISGSSHHVTFASTWIWLSVVLYAVALVVNLALVVPRLRGAAASLEHDTAGEGRVAGYAPIAASSGIVAVLLVAIVVLMVWKP